jgi:DNA-binding response OmpR family regulator
MQQMNIYNNILIIDDDVDLCKLLKSLLDSSIPHIHFAFNLAGGKRMLAELKPDVVFIDNNLPDGQAVNHIRDFKSISPSSAIIFISALDQSREKALQEGADLFLEKPLTHSNIFMALNILPNSAA